MARVADKATKNDYIVYTLKSHVEPEVFRKYNIRYVPTILVFNDGKEVRRSVGYLNYDTFTLGVKTRQAQNK